MEKDRKYFEEDANDYHERRKKHRAKEEFFLTRDLYKMQMYLHKAWYNELCRICAEWSLQNKDFGGRRMPKPMDLIRYAIAKTFFLRKGESFAQFLEDWTTHNIPFI